MEHRNRCYSNWPSPDSVIYVAKNGNDANPGTFSAPFLSIGAALDYVIDNIMDSPINWYQCVHINVAPGVYTEHLTRCHKRVYITGNTYNSGEKYKDVFIYNTGADAAHYPIDTGDGLNLIGISVYTDTGGTFGSIMGYSTFLWCTFYGGHFIEQSSSPTDIYMYFDSCYLNGSPFNLTGNVDKKRFIVLKFCDIQSGTASFHSTGTADQRVLKLENSKMDIALQMKGDWSLLMQWTEVYGDGKITFDTDGYVDIFSSIVRNGMHFTTDTPETKKVVNCIFKEIPTSEGDVTADVSVEFIEYSGNHQDHGIDGEVITVSKIKNVGGGQNVYRNIHEALKGSIIDTIINLEGDVSVSTPLTINPNIDVQIDGNKKWKLTSTHATTLAELGNNQQLSFVNMKQIVGGKKIILNGTNTHLSLVSCGRYTEQNYVNIEINSADASSCVYMVKTTLAGTGGPAIKISDVDPCIIIDRSFIKGATSHPAVEWTVDGDNKFRAKYSTFVHGDEGSNAPLVGVGANDVSISMYNCGLNATWNAADFTNTIVTANITVDSSIIF